MAISVKRSSLNSPLHFDQHQIVKTNRNLIILDTKLLHIFSFFGDFLMKKKKKQLWRLIRTHTLSAITKFPFGIRLTS